MEFSELIRNRYSCRSFSDKPLEQEKLDAILEAGRLAPSAVNYQPVRILAVKSEEGLAKIEKATTLYNPACALIVCTKKDEAWERKYDGKNHGEIDATIATDHMILAATSLGVNSLWVCRFKPEVIKEEFALEYGLVPVNILALGYQNDDWKPTENHTKRKPLEEIVKYY